nr:MAG TPA: hypothetical protein [Caudoviricetes sp.]
MVSYLDLASPQVFCDHISDEKTFGELEEA